MKKSNDTYTERDCLQDMILTMFIHRPELKRAVDMSLFDDLRQKVINMIGDTDLVTISEETGYPLWRLITLWNTPILPDGLLQFRTKKLQEYFDTDEMILRLKSLITRLEQGESLSDIKYEMVFET